MSERKVECVTCEAIGKSCCLKHREAAAPVQPPTVVHVPIPEGNESRYVEVLREQSQEAQITASSAYLVDECEHQHPRYACVICRPVASRDIVRIKAEALREAARAGRAVASPGAEEWGQAWKQEIDYKRDDETVRQADQMVYLCASIGGPLSENKWYVLAFRRVYKHIAAIRDYAASLEARLAEEKLEHESTRSVLNTIISRWQACAEAAEANAAELQGTFDLMWAADQRAIKQWQAATGGDHVWPDRAALTTWLLERAESLSLLLREVQEALTKWKAYATAEKASLSRGWAPTIVEFLDEEMSALLTRLSSDTKEEK